MVFSRRGVVVTFCPYAEIVNHLTTGSDIPDMCATIPSADCNPSRCNFDDMYLLIPREEESDGCGGPGEG